MSNACPCSGPQMAMAISGQFSELVEHLIVIDCRYPYEFEGGHIKVRGSSVKPQCLVDMPGWDSPDRLPSWRERFKRTWTCWGCAVYR